MGVEEATAANASSAARRDDERCIVMVVGCGVNLGAGV